MLNNISNKMMTMRLSQSRGLGSSPNKFKNLVLGLFFVSSSCPIPNSPRGHRTTPPIFISSQRMFFDCCCRNSEKKPFWKLKRNLKPLLNRPTEQKNKTDRPDFTQESHRFAGRVHVLLPDNRRDGEILIVFFFSQTINRVFLLFLLRETVLIGLRYAKTISVLRLLSKRKIYTLSHTLTTINVIVWFFWNG